MIDSAAPPAGPGVLVAFLNTLDQRTFAHAGHRHEPHDELFSPAALARWLAEHRLAGRPGARARATEQDLADARALRAALRDSLVSALDQDGTAAAGTIAEAGGPGTLTAFHLHLIADRSGRLRLACAPPRPGPVSRALATLVTEAATAAARGTWDRVRVCAAPDCHWAFADTSRRGDKRWCSTAVCGNRRKSADHRARRRESGA